MALPNTDFGAGRPATKAETFGTKTGRDTEVVKGLDDIEDVLDKRLETISKSSLSYPIIWNLFFDFVIY